MISLSFVPLITEKLASFTVKRSFSRLQYTSKDSMSEDGMSKDVA